MEKVGCTRQFESELSLHSFAQPFPSGDRGCANRPTRCSNRFAIRLADHQRSRQQRSCGLRYATAWIQIAYGLLGACSKFAWYLLEAFSKTHLDFLNINEFFSKITPSLFTIKEGSTSFPKPLSPQGTGDVPTALLGAQTASL